MHIAMPITLATNGSPLEDLQYINLGFSDLRFDLERRKGWNSLVREISNYFNTNLEPITDWTRGWDYSNDTYSTNRSEV